MRRASVVSAVVICVAIVVAAAGFVALRLRKPQAPPGGEAAFEPFESVEIVEARQTTWLPTADLVGTVFSLRSVMVSNELAGSVTYVGFQSGDTVDEGQVLLRQDDTLDRADLDAVKASVRVAEANVTQVQSQIRLAEVELERLTSVQSRAVAEIDLDRARTRLDTARADLGRWMAEADQARARVAQVQARLDKLTIKAPFRARAGMRTVHEGQYLAEGVDVIALQELTDTIYLDFAIPQEYAPRVKMGTTVMATGELLGPDPVPIKVVAVDAIVNYDTRNIRVRAVVDNRRGVLVPGMSVQVRVPIGEPQQLVVVPNMSVRRAAYANSVFVISPDESGPSLRAHQRFVTLGQTIGEHVTVLDGLKPGEHLAGAGSFKLRDGVKVMSAPPSTPSPPAPPAAPTDANASRSAAPDAPPASSGN